MSRLRPLFALAGAALLLMTFVGCSNSPMAPVVGAIDDAPSAPSPDAPSPPSPPIFVLEPVAVSDEEGSGSMSQQVDGAAGGEVMAGRFRVIVPAGAFAGPATITIIVPDATKIDCHLEIDPPSANRFLRPVVLEVDCRGAQVARASDLAMAWWDPALGKWDVLNGSGVDSTSWKVHVALEHFSRYSVVQTKAGW